MLDECIGNDDKLALYGCKSDLEFLSRSAFTNSFLDFPMQIDKDESWNARTFLVQGVVLGISYQLTSPRLVLPFLYLAVGAPLYLAGLLLPIVQVSRLTAQLASAPMLGGDALRKWYMALALITMALALAIVGLASTQPGAVWLAALFLLVAGVVGVTQGVSSLAYQDLIGRVLPEHRRNAIFFTKAGVAGLLTAAIALISHRDLGGETPLDRHLELLWIGIGLAVMAAIAILLIREARRLMQAESQSEDKPAPRRGAVGSMATQLKSALRRQWYRRFLMARLLFLSILFSMPFYALHGAALHAHDRRGLSVLLIATSVGYVVGGVLWRRMIDLSLATVLICAPLVAGAAGVLAVVIDLVPAAQNLWLHSVVFVLVSVASQGVSNAQSLYLVGFTTDDERPYYLAMTNAVVAAAGTAVSFGLGVLAHIQGVIWPIWFIVGLNVLAALYATRLARPAPAKAAPATAAQ